MNYKHIGTILLIGGGILIVVEATAGADAATNNVDFSQTAVGRIVYPVEQYLPISLGLALALMGAGIIWIWPWLRR